MRFHKVSALESFLKSAVLSALIFWVKMKAATFHKACPQHSFCGSAFWRLVLVLVFRFVVLLKSKLNGYLFLLHLQPSLLQLLRTYFKAGNYSLTVFLQVSQWKKQAGEHLRMEVLRTLKRSRQTKKKNASVNRVNIWMCKMIFVLWPWTS